jgi:hypothetical protein
MVMDPLMSARRKFRRLAARRASRRVTPRGPARPSARDLQPETGARSGTVEAGSLAVFARQWFFFRFS